jgi:hypothetical protein
MRQRRAAMLETLWAARETRRAARETRRAVQETRRAARETRRAVQESRRAAREESAVYAFRPGPMSRAAAHPVPLSTGWWPQPPVGSGTLPAM